MVLPTPLYFDRKVIYERIEYIDIDCHFIKKKVLNGHVIFHDLCTNEQPIDLLTKGLSRSQQTHLLSNLGMKNISIPRNFKGPIRE